MPTTYKVLGQSAPSATTDTTLYTVPSATQTIISSIIVSNRASDIASYRIAIRPNGATIANEHYICYNSSVGSNDSVFITVGITLDAADVITVFSSNSNLTFSVFGSEIS